MISQSPTIVRNALFLLSIALCGAAYAASLHGSFLFDDFPTLVQNPALRALGTETQDWLAVALSSGSGMLRRPLSMLTFGANAALFGMSPLAFKLVNLAIHIANGLLVFMLALRLAPQLLAQKRRSSWTTGIALFAASAWLLHPLNLSGVAYIVQRMNELSALFTLAGLVCYADSRNRMLDGERALPQALIGLCVLGLSALASKENGALIVAYALVIEASCFRFNALHLDERLVLRGFFAIAILTPLALFLAFLLSHPGWLVNSYSIRDFTLYERVLTEGRVLCHYLLWIVVPNPNWMGIYHDDIMVSKALFTPPSTAIAIAFLGGIVTVAWRIRRTHPALAFGVAWFLLGHSIESTILPLELVFEHRNYLPMAGLLLGLACLVADSIGAHSGRSRAAAVLAILFILVCAAGTTVRSIDWSSPLRMALTDVRHHPASARNQYEAGRALVLDGAKNGRRDAADDQALPYFDEAARLDRGDTHGLIEGMLIRARRGSVPTAAVTDLRTRIAAAPTYTKANPFLNMLVTAGAEETSFQASDIEDLVEAALANRHFPPKVRAMIMNNYGAYRFNVGHDAQAAVSLTLAAAAEEPTNPYFELNLAKIALAMKETAKARHHLEKARALDGARTYASEIDAISRLLDAQVVDKGDGRTPT